MNKERFTAYQNERIEYLQKVAGFVAKLDPKTVYRLTYIRKDRGGGLHRAEMIGKIMTFNTESVNFDVLAATESWILNRIRRRHEKDDGRRNASIKFRALFEPKYYAFLTDWHLEKSPDMADLTICVGWEYVSPLLEKMFKE